MQVQIVKPTIPDALKQCGDEPIAPAITTATKQSAVAAYAINIEKWGRDCHDHLRLVTGLIQ